MAGQSFQSGQTLGQFFEPLYYNQAGAKGPLAISDNDMMAWDEHLKGI
jgi:hypothetical protein